MMTGAIVGGKSVEQAAKLQSELVVQVEESANNVPVIIMFSQSQRRRLQLNPDTRSSQ